MNKKHLTTVLLGISFLACFALGAMIGAIFVLHNDVQVIREASQAIRLCLDDLTACKGSK